MKTFFKPRLMFNLGLLQIGVGDANLIKAQRQAPFFNIGTEFLQAILTKIVFTKVILAKFILGMVKWHKIVRGKMISGVAHEK